MPLPANVKISKEVKSGRKNVSFSYSAGQGNKGRNLVAAFTKSANFTLMGLLTKATKPINKRKHVYIFYSKYHFYKFTKPEKYWLPVLVS